MRRIARITGRKRAMHELPQLLGDTHAHRDHCAACPKGRYDRVSLLQRQTAADRNRLLPLAREGLRHNFPFMLPA
jgi:hypothetical protein